MYLLIDFEGFSGRTKVKELLGLEQITIPCMMSYKVVETRADLAEPCKHIETDWFKVDKDINRRVKDKMLTLMKKHKIEYIVYHGDYEHQLFKIIGLKVKEIDLNNLYNKSLTTEEVTCFDDVVIEDGGHASDLLYNFIKEKTISPKVRQNITSYNKLDVARLAQRFQKLLSMDFFNKAYIDKTNFIKLQNKIK